jgi:hypothetical protein
MPTARQLGSRAKVPTPVAEPVAGSSRGGRLKKATENKYFIAEGISPCQIIWPLLDIHLQVLFRPLLTV